MNLAYSCKKAAELITLAQDEPLGTLDELRLKIHLSMCGNCRNVEQQIAQIGVMMRSPYECQNSSPNNDSLSQSKDDRLSE
ncbi:MAG: zf-HC2 domain-containing protein [Polaromonas sp.]